MKKAFVAITFAIATVIFFGQPSLNQNIPGHVTPSVTVVAVERIPDHASTEDSRRWPPEEHIETDEQNLVDIKKRKTDS